MGTAKSGRPSASPDESSGGPLLSMDLFDLLPIGVVQLAADGRVLAVNRRLRELTGLPDGTGRGITFEDLGWSPAQGDCRDLWEALLAPVAPDESGQLVRLRPRSGAEVWVRASASPVRTPDPEVAYLVWVADVTEEHRINEDLRAQREQFRILADHVGDVVLVHRAHEIIWASPSALTVLGRDPRDLAGLTLADLAPAEDIRDLPVLPEFGTATHRLRLRHVNGTLRWFETTLSARRPYGSDPTIYAVLRDIEDQVRAEQALAESERLLRLAVDASPDGWAIVRALRDEQGAIVDLRYARANETALRRRNLSEAEIVGSGLEKLIPGTAGQVVGAGVLAALSSGEVQRLRVPPTPDWPLAYEGFVAPIDADTALTSWRDVTELAEAERLLGRAHEESAEMRATLQTALDATSDGFVVYQLIRQDDGTLGGIRVVHANAAGAESLGRSPEDMIGMEIHDFFPDVESSGLWDCIVVAATTKAPQQHRVQVFDAEGRWKDAWDNSVAPVGEERMAITWRNVSAEEAALRQLARTRDEAMYSATHDALTALPNRVLLRQHLNEALRVCHPAERVGIVFVDLDQFKAVNDNHGHSAGDAVLRETAARLSRMVRHGDLAARLAGDEFVLVLTGLAPDWSPDQFFARATAALAQPVQADDVELHPSASLGAVLADPRRQAVDVDGLLKQADAAMYLAKAAKRR